MYSIFIGLSFNVIMLIIFFLFVLSDTTSKSQSKYSKPSKKIKIKMERHNNGDSSFFWYYFNIEEEILKDISTMNDHLLSSLQLTIHKDFGVPDEEFNNTSYGLALSLIYDIMNNFKTHKYDFTSAVSAKTLNNFQQYGYQIKQITTRITDREYEKQEILSKLFDKNKKTVVITIYPKPSPKSESKPKPKPSPKPKPKQNIPKIYDEIPEIHTDHNNEKWDYSFRLSFPEPVTSSLIAEKLMKLANNKNFKLAEMLFDEITPNEGSSKLVLEYFDEIGKLNYETDRDEYKVAKSTIPTRGPWGNEKVEDIKQIKQIQYYLEPKGKNDVLISISFHTEKQQKEEEEDIKQDINPPKQEKKIWQKINRKINRTHEEKDDFWQYSFNIDKSSIYNDINSLRNDQYWINEFDKKIWEDATNKDPNPDVIKNFQADLATVILTTIWRKIEENNTQNLNQGINQQEEITNALANIFKQYFKRVTFYIDTLSDPNSATLYIKFYKPEKFEKKYPYITDDINSFQFTFIIPDSSNLLENKNYRSKFEKEIQDRLSQIQEKDAQQLSTTIFAEVVALLSHKEQKRSSIDRKHYNQWIDTISGISIEKNQENNEITIEITKRQQIEMGMESDSE